MESKKQNKEVEKKEQVKSDQEAEIEKQEYQEVEVDTKVTFQSLGVCQELVHACERLKYQNPTPIQKDSLPYTLKQRDIIGLAETGSGKTLAFALPILQTLLDQPQPFFALVLSPTRELCVQISEHFEALGASIALKSVVIVGGLDPMTQAIALSKKPHIIIGTPGRVLYHLQNTQGFSLQSLKYFVLDEADKLLNMDFEKEINQILEIIPQNRNTFLFSATMTNQVSKLQRASLHNPVKIEVNTKYQTVSTLTENYLFIPSKYKDCYLVYLLTEFAGSTSIIFAITCMNAIRICLMIRNLGFQAVTIHGQMSQVQRLGALNKFKSGQRKILVATDVAARGLDIQGVDLVFNYDIPQNAQDYVHRVGRTARAGRAGRALSLVTQYDVENFQKIEFLMNKKLENYKTEEPDVLIFYERVQEAQRIANQELKDLLDKQNQDKDDKNDDENDSKRRKKPTNPEQKGDQKEFKKKQFNLDI